MSKPLSIDEWHEKIDRLEQAKQAENWSLWQQIALEGESASDEMYLDPEHR